MAGQRTHGVAGESAKEMRIPSKSENDLVRYIYVCICIYIYIYVYMNMHNVVALSGGPRLHVLCWRVERYRPTSVLGWDVHGCRQGRQTSQG